ncbi:hypothetical protein [Psychrobacter faecalis]
MFKKFTIFLIIFGFAHGCFMSYLRNKDKTEDVYKVLESNKEYSFERIDEILKNEGVDKAKDYLKNKENSLMINNREFIEDNPRYTPIKDRGNYEE